MKTTKYHHQHGSTLIIALLFTVVVSTLVLITLQQSALESKMANYFNNKNLSFALAEQALHNKEQELLKGRVPREAKLISDRICGVLFYSISIKATSGIATTKLQSIFAKIGDTSKCEPKPTLLEGRQSWMEILYN